MEAYALKEGGISGQQCYCTSCQTARDVGIAKLAFLEVGVAVIGRFNLIGHDNVLHCAYAVKGCGDNVERYAFNKVRHVV